MKRELTFVVVAALALTVSACGMFESPTAPSPPPDSPVHEVPVPGKNSPFKWWISDITPARNSQLSVGQSWFIQVASCGPDGYSYFMDMGFSSGPDPDGEYPLTGNSSSSSGSTKGCGKGGVGGTITANTPNLPYYRFRIWIEAGEEKIRYNAPDRPPDLVIDELIGWQRTE